MNWRELRKRFPFWNLRILKWDFSGCLATVESHFPLCLCVNRRKVVQVVSVCTYLPPGPVQTRLCVFRISRVLQTPCSYLLQLLWAPRPLCWEHRLVPSPHSRLRHPTPARFLPGHSHLWTCRGFFAKSCLWWLNSVGRRVEKAGVSPCSGDFPTLKIVILCSTPPSLLNPQKREVERWCSGFEYVLV